MTTVYGVCVFLLVLLRFVMPCPSSATNYACSDYQTYTVTLNKALTMYGILKNVELTVLQECILPYPKFYAYKNFTSQDIAKVSYEQSVNTKKMLKIRKVNDQA